MLSNIFLKGNVDFYLKELAKEYRKICGRKASAEIILIGGASVLITQADEKTHGFSRVDDSLQIF